MNKLLEYKGYHAKIDFDADDCIFVGSVIGINDSLNFHGKTVDELKKAFSDCIEDYLEICKLYDKEPDKEYKGSLNIRIGYELHKKAVLAAHNQDTSINQIICEALEEYFDPNKKTQTVFINEETISLMMDFKNRKDFYNGEEITETQTEEEIVYGWNISKNE